MVNVAGKNNCYDFHFFICTNERKNGYACGGESTKNILTYTKDYFRSLDLNFSKKVQVSSSGCLNMCNHKPVVVIYPEGIWYTCNSTEDIDKIIKEHVLLGKTIPELLIHNEQ